MTYKWRLGITLFFALMSGWYLGYVTGTHIFSNLASWQPLVMGITYLIFTAVCVFRLFKDASEK